MKPVRLVHLSDLHFSDKKDPEIWRMVVDFINTKVVPDAILITGDVTDNASESEFALARRSLDMLEISRHTVGQPKFYIIPGNHDRYEFLGNRFLGRWLRGKREHKAARFEKYFMGRHYPCPHSEDILVGPKDNLWNIRIVGLDTNHPESWFAQGAINEASAARAAEAAIAGVNSDMVIALMHHHALPIPKVERAAMGKGIQNVANVTGMLNAGVLLEHLSDAQVNIALHGHEHSPHRARFTGAGRLAGPVVVLGAGSGTGEETGKKWALERIHLNVLELDVDRSVHLVQVNYVNTAIALDPERIKILSGEAIRRSRFVRRNRQLAVDDSSNALPKSRIRKIVDIEINRGVTITQTKTDIIVDEDWTMTTRNNSGYLDPVAGIEIEWANGEMDSHLATFARVPGSPDTFHCGLKLGDGRRLANRFTTSWHWSDGALLYKTDMRVYPEECLSGLRGSDKRDFVVLRVSEKDDFEQASIIVNIPNGVITASNQWKVFIETPEDRELVPSSELTRLLEFCGAGHVELRIAYPLPGYAYYVSWSLAVSDFEVAEAAVSVVELVPLAKQYAATILAACDSILSLASHAGALRIGLYGWSHNDALELELITGTEGAPQSLSMQTPRSRVRAALFGEVQIVGCDEASDIKVDEGMVVYASVKAEMVDGGLSSLLLRVSTLDKERSSWYAYSDALPDETSAEVIKHVMLSTSEVVRILLTNGMKL